MSPFLAIAVILWLYMSLWFGLAVLIKRNDIADIAWGLGFVLVGWISWVLGGVFPLPALILNLLVSVWGVRLAWHIFSRNRRKGEDARYKEWRDTWSNFYVRSYLQVFMLQGLFLYIIALPIVAVNTSSSVLPSLSLLFFSSIAVWVVGFLFESIGDWQLKQFISKPENKGILMTTGLWRYSRHPNYFGEAVQWWGVFLLAYSQTTNILLIVSPILITYLLRFVSGVPLLEKKYAERPDWIAYATITSAFIPWFPRKTSS